MPALAAARLLSSCSSPPCGSSPSAPLPSTLRAALLLTCLAGVLAACGESTGDAASSNEGDASSAAPDGGGLQPDAGDLPPADASTDLGADATPDPTADVDSDAHPPPVNPAWRATEDDFGCLQQWTPVRGFYLTNPLGALDAAIAAAESGFIDEVPPGTIVQLVPLEAMVKLAPGQLPETGDWEYFLLDTSGGRTSIVQRGGADVENVAGSCYGCHIGALSRDYICEDSGLCSAGAVPRGVVDRLVANDSRCR